ncbi:MAG: bifunctional oligoribonuclease/PAP phosphatase NrnA [Cyanobacteria bacterium HKST-UBA06]|nr:bifunctional oligoribonuclease/PAP phosphatase NrnA [Cyanobacteria bacterium HKST-UBA04]MCA9807321.1 bifunctional oligoribonuclease/PAP phosphatase NrnA [Cyanobacteria bacterium HKST-UBA06]
MITEQDCQAFKKALENAKTVLLTPHVGPDGDALGSMMGLYFTLTRQFSHFDRVDPVMTGTVPKLFHFLPGADQIKNAETDALLDQYDLAISVDCGAIERLGAAQPHFSKATCAINIDHHVSNNRYGTLNIIDETASASGEVVADLLNGNGIAMDADTANNLFVAILTDTGGFKYSNTTAKLFGLAAQLTEAGAKPEHINRHLYGEVPKAQTMMQAHAVAQARFNADNALCWTLVSRELLNRFDAQDEHVEGLVELLREMQPVKLSAVLKETVSGHTKISLRSDTPLINVADIAARWGGGGHKMAAGATIDVPPQTFENDLIPVLEAALKALV